MEWAVCTASCDSEDEVDQEAYEDVAAESSTNHSQASIDLAFVSKAASAKNSLASRDSVKDEAGKKPSHKDVRDLTHFGEKDGHKVPVPQGMCPPLTVNASEKDGVSYSASKDHTMETMSDEEEEEQKLVTQEDLGESAEDRHNYAAEFGISRKQNPERFAVQRKRTHFTEDGKDQESKLAKISEQHRKNQMPCESTECGDCASDPACCQSSENIHADHLEDNYVVEEPKNRTERSELLGHNSQEVRTVEVEYNCPDCSLICKNSFQLIQHRGIAHDKEKPFTCPDCNKHFKTADGMSSHQRQLHNIKNAFQCLKCSTTFNSLSLLNRHRKKDAECRESFECTECSYTCLSSFKLIRHQSLAHAKGSLKCLECNNYFAKPADLVNHQIASYNAMKPFECSNCNETFVSSSCLNNHLLMRCKLYKCAECNLTFSSILLLDRHIKTVHGSEDRYKCSDCSERFSELDLMKQHQLLIHNVKEYFPCAHCIIVFYNLEQLMKHQAVCSGGAPYRCAECNVKYKYSALLTIHLWHVHKVKTHTRCADYTREFAVVEALHFPREEMK